MAPTGVAGHGLPSGQIWALYFEPATTFDADETLDVATNSAIDIALKTNVRVALFRIGYINSPRLKTDEIVPPVKLIILLSKGPHWPYGECVGLGRT